ncbi:uncharacterized protein LOC124159469 [Ischnura elegans]|uniref:uncharacterized protein LOC124159469 n=1 Tax=Ischnura elegans TaxID=197161 RepID=UPI001ED8B412|nr:uncharacterized protein LOC124159469 [Ischnura elegans]
MKASLVLLLALGCVATVFVAAGLTTPKPTPSPWFRCPSAGTFPNPYDCSKYFVCIMDENQELTAWAQKCPGKLLFNPEKNLCDFKGNVDCKAHPTKHA